MWTEEIRFWSRGTGQSGPLLIKSVSKRSNKQLVISAPNVRPLSKQEVLMHELIQCIIQSIAHSQCY